jgi:hypothetical protein
MLALLAFALVAWGLCGATIGVARGIMPMQTALRVHAGAAPIIAGTLAYLYARFFAVTTPLATGLAFVGVVIVMDAGLIAPFVERSWDMFRSPIGTWVPFVLIVLGAYFRYPELSQLGWDEPPPARFTRATWAFVLEPLDGSRTRLLVRARGVNRPWWLSLLLAAVFGPAHVIMQRKQLLNLKARAEGSAPAGR